MTSRRFKELILPCRMRMYRYAHAMLHSGADAEDAVQDAYVRLWERRESLPEPANVEAYVMRTVHNICIDRLRNSGHEISTDDPIPDVVAEDSTAESSADSDTRLLLGLINRLPERHRQIIIMRELKQYTFEFIERHTGLSAVNIRVILSRARKQLKQLYQDEHHGTD